MNVPVPSFWTFTARRTIAGRTAGKSATASETAEKAVLPAKSPVVSSALSRKRTLTPLTLERVNSAGLTSVYPERSLQDGKFRILVVAARFLPELGGIENHIQEVTRRVTKHSDLDITVLATDRSGILSAREDFEGFTVLRCRAYPQNRDYYFAPGLYRLIRNSNYDLVHCQGIHTAVPVLAMIAARRAGIPYVVTLHTGGHSSELRHRLRSLQWRTLGPLLRKATAVIAVSRFEQKIFQEACHLDRSRVKIIQNGGSLPVGSRRRNPTPGLIVSSGRLERYKGHQRIIEALPIIQRSIPNATLHILGAGPYEDQLLALIKRLGIERSVTIEYIAPADRGRMADYLSQAAVFASLSEYEAHPLAVMEALALGIPTVGLNTAGIGDLIEDGLVTGIPRDASLTTIAQVLVTALDGPSTSSFTMLPTWDTAGAELADVYREAARGSSEARPLARGIVRQCGPA